ncbi:LuxR C-terminal-related transcriptional regulator [Belliella sp. DSM 111904]|uniref:LuxR C-terminal-related transcriptional regulator n=1 Tax=Belliella filtrata TaxID=2923435 RepID=A0ABS9V3H8_9BACT|nr:LuxR C-terminal-related transcriptional regulator [Belliella filtrata]MCH7410960.1 LuxR C-terminal-related transcriptional regulator [Belliella filtrata]
MDSFLRDKLRSQGKFSDFFIEWKEREFTDTDIDEDKLLKDLEILSQQIGMKEGIIIGCIDYRDLSLAFFTDNVEDIMGYPSSFFKKKGMEAVLMMLHPDDVPELAKFQKIVFDLLQTLSREEMDSFEFTYTVRWVHKTTKEIKWFTCKVRPYLIDRNKNVVFDLHVLLLLNTPPQINSFDWSYSYTSKNGDKIHATKYEPKTLNFKLTKKERQISNMILEGKSSQEIADELNIAINTVNTHRKNILKKLNAKTTAEMVKILLNTRMK